MPLVVETGDGLPNSNSYVDEDEFVSYFEDRNDSIAERTSNEIVSALLYATRKVDSLAMDEGCDWVDRPLDEDQALEFPRYVLGAVIPQRVKEATMELARQHLDTGSLNDPFDPSDQLLSALEIGPIGMQWDRTAGKRGDGELSEVTNSYVVNLVSRYMEYVSMEVARA